jgi:hypothetical protein
VDVADAAIALVENRVGMGLHRRGEQASIETSSVEAD